MSLRAAKQLLRKDVKLRILELSEEEKLRQSKVVTDKVRMNVYNSGKGHGDASLLRVVQSEFPDLSSVTVVQLV